MKSLTFILILTLLPVLKAKPFPYPSSEKRGVYQLKRDFSLHTPIKDVVSVMPEKIQAPKYDLNVKGNPAADTTVPKWYEMITNVPEDWARYYNTFLTREHLGGWLAVGVSTAALIITDQDSYELHDKFKRQSEFNKVASDFFTELGDGRTQFTLAALFAAGGWMYNDSRALRTASQIVEGVLAAGSIVQVLKHTTGRESPFIAKRTGGRWVFFPNQIEYAKHVAEYDAYPSGHLCTSMAAFTIIAENYPEYEWIMPVGWALGAGIAIGMVNTGIHWYSDYPLSIALGIGFGKIIAHREAYKKKEQQEEKKSVSYEWYPYIGITGNGVGLKVSF